MCQYREGILIFNLSIQFIIIDVHLHVSLHIVYGHPFGQDTAILLDQFLEEPICVSIDGRAVLRMLLQLCVQILEDISDQFRSAVARRAGDLLEEFIGAHAEFADGVIDASQGYDLVADLVVLQFVFLEIFFHRLSLIGMVLRILLIFALLLELVHHGEMRQFGKELVGSLHDGREMVRLYAQDIVDLILADPPDPMHIEKRPDDSIFVYLFLESELVHEKMFTR